MIQEPSVFSWFNGSVDAPFSTLVYKIIHVTSIFIGILWIFFVSDFCFFRSDKISSVLHHKFTLNITIFGVNVRSQKCQTSKMTELTLWKDLVENIPRPFSGTFWISNLKINFHYVKDEKMTHPSIRSSLRYCFHWALCSSSICFAGFRDDRRISKKSVIRAPPLYVWSSSWAIFFLDFLA